MYDFTGPEEELRAVVTGTVKRLPAWFDPSRGSLLDFFTGNKHVELP